MHLEKLTIQGFKSFAHKNTLVFPGMVGKSRRGITAVVGPNGSGKSNIADAVRWALGEQSMKVLRGKKSEDVIFSGSDRKSRLGMAEVSLHLNNESGQALLDYSQVVLTRRLFRDGDSEYLINGSRARLIDIQMLLAKANFGQKTYSVIGQGMVEGFLNTSLAERKEFFDEATGVKQFQIKRDESLNKLRASYENLSQVNMLLAEIEPRLRSLTRQVNKLKKRSELEAELKKLQLNYYGRVWHDINGQFNEYNNKFLELEKTKREKEKKLAKLNEELAAIESQRGGKEDAEEEQGRLNDLQKQKEALIERLARLQARAEVRLEARGEFNLSWLYNKKEELEKALSDSGEEIKILKDNIGHDRRKLKELEDVRAGLDRKISALNNSLLASGFFEESRETKMLGGRLQKILAGLERIETEADIKEIKRRLAELKRSVANLLKSVAEKTAREKLEKIQEDLPVFTREKEQVITRINESNFRVLARSERVKLLQAEAGRLETELLTVKQKLNQHKNAAAVGELDKEKSRLKTRLAEIDERLNRAQARARALSRAEADRTNRLFGLQKNLQFGQNEINKISLRLNELKINSTRFETKLEGLEAQIRRDLGGLREVKAKRPGEAVEPEKALAEIESLKRQLELIGGIDPETEKEYRETKERYDFLSGQVNDLTKAINSLKEVVAELDSTIKEKFDKEFKIISGKFEEYFKILFSGGSAKIIKIMDDQESAGVSGPAGADDPDKKLSAENKDELSIRKIKFLKNHNATGLAGIEIQATPPGKKIKSISMLSGGERALTAIALICAIISANPSPFVVLDEVDAALDEANSERLAKILDDLSHKTQFIIITHNRASMRRANVLYGVTMGSDGVSKLLSIKLAEAEAEKSKK